MIKKERLEYLSERLEKNSEVYSKMIAESCRGLHRNGTFLECNVKQLAKNVINLVDIAAEYNTLVRDFEETEYEERKELIEVEE